MNLESYLAVSAVLFCLGLVIFVTRRNTIAILMGVELIMNAAALNFVTFSKYTASQGHPLDGQVFAIFIILIAASEAVVALGIALAVYKENKHVQADQLAELQG